MAVIISYKGNFFNISGEFVLLASFKLYKESGLNSPKLSLLNYGSDSTGDIIPPSTNDSNSTFNIYINNTRRHSLYFSAYPILILPRVNNREASFSIIDS